MKAKCQDHLGKYDEAVRSIDMVLGGKMFGNNYLDRHYPVFANKRHWLCKPEEMSKEHCLS
jgi:hypothetical protein